jgi:hypothetical protein
MLTPCLLGGTGPRVSRHLVYDDSARQNRGAYPEKTTRRLRTTRERISQVLRADCSGASQVNKHQHTNTHDKRWSLFCLKETVSRDGYLF